MVYYWLTVVQKGLQDSLDFIQQSRSGILFGVLVLVLTGLWLWKKHGWKDAVKHWWRTVGEGLVIAMVAWVLVLFIHLIYEPFHLQNDEAARAAQAIMGRDNAQNQTLLCGSELKGVEGKVELLQRQVTAQQTQISGEQTIAATQQSTFNVCVTTLSKTNVPIPQKATMLLTPDDPPVTPQGKHRALILLLTNKPVSPVRLMMWCQKDVTHADVRPFGSGAFSGGAELLSPGISGISSPKVWQIGMSFPTWAPDQPLLVEADYDADDLGQCFTRPL